MKVLLFVNPEAGDGLVKKYISATKDYLFARNLKYEIFYSSFPCNISQYINENRSEIERFDAFVAVGGDGTSSEVISTLTECGLNHKPVGIIPLGTGNDLARNLKIKQNNYKRTIKSIIKKRMISADICSINNKYFTNYVGFGLDGSIVEKKVNGKTKLPRKFAYIKPFFKAMQNLKIYNYDFTLDGKTIKTKGINLVISNSSSYLGSLLTISKHASIRDGIFEVSVLKKIPCLRTLLSMPFLNIKAFKKGREIEQYSGKEMHIIFTGKVPLLQVDGETFNNSSREYFIKIYKRRIKLYSGAKTL